jgi:predicted ester cyclase
MELTKQNKAIARREIEEFEGKGDVSLGPSLFSADYKLTFGGAPAMDHAGHEQLLKALRGAFPDLRILVAEQIATPDRVANHWIAQGTHRGAFQGIPATGKAVTFTGNNIMHLSQGRIRALWGQLDGYGLMAQLGVIPQPVPDYPKSNDGDSGPGTAAPPGGDVVRRFVGKFNAGDVGSIDEEYDRSYVLDFPGGPTGAGKAGIRRATEAFLIAFPDLRFAIEDLFEEESRVAWRWTMTGTHRGALGPFTASGRPVRLTGISITKLIRGKITFDRVRADMVGLLAQIGAVPAAPN